MHESESVCSGLEKNIKKPRKLSFFFPIEFSWTSIPCNIESIAFLSFHFSHFFPQFFPAFTQFFFTEIDKRLLIKRKIITSVSRRFGLLVASLLLACLPATLLATYFLFLFSTSRLWHFSCLIFQQHHHHPSVAYL